jgi:hypothetical protein
MDVFNTVGDISAYLTVLGRRIRPALDALGDVLDTHGEVEPIQNMADWPLAHRLAQRARACGTVAQDRHRRLLRHSEAL